MPSNVKKTHPQYDAMADKWQRCRDVVSGRDAVLAAGERYLPRLKDQTTEDYNAYKTRAKFFNATWRTISALVGMLFRKPPIIEAAESVKTLMDDVTMGGVSFQVFAQQAALEAFIAGRMGILVDYPQQSTEGMTAAQAAKLNLRPTMQRYSAETIINWRTQWIRNQTVLTLVVLAEEAAAEGNGEFDHKTEKRFRVLDLVKTKDGAGLDYRVRVFRVSKDGEDQQIGEDIFPVMNNKPLAFIPFYFLGVDDATPDVDEPPLIDLVDLNLDHYRMSADHKHGLHFTGLPTPVVSGYAPGEKAEKLYVGSASAWCFPDPQAKAVYLEFTGQGLEAISNELKETEQQMATLGSRLLSSEKKAVETAAVAQIHRAGETSILASISESISTALTKALRTFSEWAGATAECSVSLNHDFMPVGLDSQQLTALVGAWQSGAISMQVLFENLQRAEIIESELTLEEMQGQIGSSPIPKP